MPPLSSSPFSPANDKTRTTMASSASATRQLPTLSLDAAKVVTEGAQEKAKQMGIGELSSAVSHKDKGAPTHDEPQTSTSPS